MMSILIHVYLLTLSFRCFVSDKSPQMNEFLSHIKSSTEMSAMFESIQKDAQASISDSMVMDRKFVHLFHGKNKLHLDEIMKMSTLY
jgi:hypothetical protein